MLGRRGLGSGRLQIENDERGFGDRTGTETIIEQFDNIIMQLQPRIAFDKVGNKQARELRFRLAYFHYQINDIYGGCASSKGSKQVDRVAY